MIRENVRTAAGGYPFTYLTRIYWAAKQEGCTTGSAIVLNYHYHLLGACTLRGVQDARPRHPIWVGLYSSTHVFLRGVSGTVVEVIRARANRKDKT